MLQWLYTNRYFHSEGDYSQRTFRSRSIYSAANRDALVTTGSRDRVAAPRRASHCSSYIALNLPSPFQIFRAVRSRHCPVGRVKFTSRSIDYRHFALYCLCITSRFFRVGFRDKREHSTSRNITINRDAVKHSVVRVVVMYKEECTGGSLRIYLF